MVSVRSVVPLEARARAALVLEREGPVAVFGSWRADEVLAEVVWASGGRPAVLRGGLDRLVGEFVRSGDPAAGLAVVWLAQAFVLARMDEDPGMRR